MVTSRQKVTPRQNLEANKGQIATLFRAAVGLQCAIWDIDGQIEHLLGCEIDGLSSSLEDFAVGCSTAADANTISEDEIIKQVTALIDGDPDKEIASG